MARLPRKLEIKLADAIAVLQRRTLPVGALRYPAALSEICTAQDQTDRSSLSHEELFAERILVAECHMRCALERGRVEDAMESLLEVCQHHVDMELAATPMYRDRLPTGSEVEMDLIRHAPVGRDSLAGAKKGRDAIAKASERAKHEKLARDLWSRNRELTVSDVARRISKKTEAAVSTIRGHIAHLKKSC
jgi:hypothetical protein